MLCWETHPLRLNPISSSYPYPLFFDCPLAPQSKVTGGDGWNLPLRNETLILHQLTLIAFCKRHANSHFQDFVFSSGDYSCITAAMLALTQCHLTLTWWRCFPTPLHIINQVIEYNITLLHYWPLVMLYRLTLSTYPARLHWYYRSRRKCSSFSPDFSKSLCVICH